MKKYLFKYLFFLIIITKAYYASSQESSAESSNPFNELMRPQNGIDLFSGAAAINYPFFKLKGINDLDITVKLRYSSNVYINARADNENAATGWCGLGWRMGYGKIRCNDKGTMNYKDDEWWWESPEGITQEIRLKPGTPDRYYLQRNPYWKVEPEFVEIGSAGNVQIIIGWTLTATDGRKYKYGDIYNSSGGNPTELFHYDGITRGSTAATRYTYCWYTSKHVGKGFGGDPYLYPYQWDLCQIEDIYGNTITFTYQQDLEYISSTYDCSGEPAGTCHGTAPNTYWRAKHQYTRASYLKEIKNPEGAKIVFNLHPKQTNEYVDPYQFEPEIIDKGDGFMEFYETKYIHGITVYGPEGTGIDNRIRSFGFRYDLINQHITHGNYVKRLLVNIRETDGINGKLLTDAKFIYNTDPKQFNNSDYNYGALKSMVTPKGGKVEYEYTKTSVGIRPHYGIDAPDIPNHSALTRNASGVLSNGNPYFVVLFTQTNNFSEHTPYCASYYPVVFTWDGTHWKEQRFNPNPLERAGETEHLNHRISASMDYFVCYSSAGEIHVFEWNGEEWVPDVYTDDINPYKNSIQQNGYTVKTAENFFVAHEIHEIDDIACDGEDWTSECWRHKAWVYHKKSNQWESATADGLYETYLFFNRRLLISLGKNTILAGKYDSELSDDDQVLMCRWNGSSWSKEYLNDSEFDRYMVTASVGTEGEFLGFATVNGNDNGMFVLNWNGEDWKWKTKDYHVESSKINSGKDYFSTVLASEYYWAFNWDGSGWVGQELRIDGTNPCRCNLNVMDKVMRLYPGKNMLAVTCLKGAHAWQWNISESKWKNYLEVQPNSVNGPDWSAFEIGNNYLCYYTTENFDFNPNCDVQNEDFKTTYTWNGVSWEEKQLFGSGVVEDIIGTNENLNVARFDYGGTGTFSIQHFSKAQDELNESVVNYVVSKKTVHDVFSEKELVTHYTFHNNPTASPPDTALYDTRTRSAKYNRVEAYTEPLSEHGKTVYYLFNDTKCHHQHLYGAYGGGGPDYDKLDGRIYRVINYRSNSTTDDDIVSEERMWYSAYHNSSWPQGIYDAQVTGKETIVDKVHTIKSFTYNNENGLVRKTKVYNIDQSLKKTAVTRYAYEQNPQHAGMVTAHMLNQICKTTIYEGEAVSGNERSSTAIKWSNTLHAGKNGNAWVPYETYSWRVDMDNNGVPDPSKPYTDFWDNATNWKLSKRNVKYDIYGLLEETENALNEKTISIYGTTYQNPIGTAANTSYRECGVFTGDYNITEDGESSPSTDHWWDKKNGYEKGTTNTVELNEDPNHTHFGNKSIHVVNDYAFGRNFKVYPGRTYLFSAWVKVTNGTLYLAGDFYNCIISPTEEENTWPMLHGTHISAGGFGAVQSTSVTAKSPAVWEYVELEISTAALESQPGSWYARYWIGNPDEAHWPDDVTAYIDEIRFHPKDALAQSVYYDEKKANAILMTDANSKPKHLITYDEFNRPVKEEKMAANDPADKVTISENSYSLITGNMPDLPKNPVPANYDLIPSTTVQLGWSGGDPNSDYGIDYSIYFGDVNPPPFETTQRDIEMYTKNGLLLGKTYYWKIIANDPDGNTTEGPVWGVITAGYYGDIMYGYPQNGYDVGHATTVELGWSGSGYDEGTISYDIYMGDANEPTAPHLIASDISDFTYTITGLPAYPMPLRKYWRIVAKKSGGTPPEQSGEVYFITRGINIF